jgi:hypothetical protein
MLLAVLRYAYWYISSVSYLLPIGGLGYAGLGFGRWAGGAYVCMCIYTVCVLLVWGVGVYAHGRVLAQAWGCQHIRANGRGMVAPAEGQCGVYGGAIEPCTAVCA